MTNPNFSSIELYKDVESKNYYNILINKGIAPEEAMKIIMEHSRDNSRTTIQCNDDINSGFSTGTPWIKLCNNYKEINIEKQINDENSILHYYRKLISLRKKYEVIADGITLPLSEENQDIYAFKRVNNSEEILVLTNFYGKESSINLDFDTSGYENILNNDNNNKILQNKMTLQPYNALVFYKKY